MLLKEKNKSIATYLAFALIPLSGLITDMYLPSMPQMAKQFNVSQQGMQLTLSFFLMSYGIMQFVTGSIMDSFGRQKFVLLSLLVFIFSCIVIANAGTIELIYAMRVLQGVTTGFIVVAKRAFFIDVYTGEKQKNYLSILSIVWSIAPIIAPFVGGYIESYFHWQVIFYSLAGYGVVMLALEYIYSGETLKDLRSFKRNTIVTDYKTTLTDTSFVSMLFVFGLSYSSVMLFALSAPFIIERVLHYSPLVTGYAFLLSGLGWLFGGLLNKLLNYKSMFQKSTVANVLQILVIVLMVTSEKIVSNVYTFITFSFFVNLTAGFIFNNYLAFCLGRFPKIAGVVSGVCGGANFLITSASSYVLVWVLHPQSQSHLAYGFLILSLVIFFILHFILKPSLIKSLKPF